MLLWITIMTLEIWCWVFLFAIFCPSAVMAQNKYVQKVKECYARDYNKIDYCLLQYMQDVLPMLKVGVPELKIPVMDPFVIDAIDFDRHGSTLQASAKISNLRVIGASHSSMTTLKVDKRARIITAIINFPHLYITGDYIINGTVMLLPLVGDGRVHMNLTGIVGVVRFHIVPKGAGVEPAKVDMDIAVRDVLLRLSKLLGDDSVVRAINNIIVDNSRLIFEDIKPAFVNKFAEGISILTRQLFWHLPPDVVIS